MENDYTHVTISREFLKELEEKAKDSEYYKGRVDGLQYVIVTIANVLKDSLRKK